MTEFVRSVKTPPSGDLPISLEEAKNFCDETTEVRNALIQAAIHGGFAQAEEHLNRAVRLQTRLWNFRTAPDDQVVLEPFVDASAVVRRAVNGEWETVEAADYSTSGDTGEIFGTNTNEEAVYWRRRLQHPSFPEPEGDPVGAFFYQIEAVCGWADDDLPGDLRTAILTYVRDVYKFRGIRDIGRPSTKPWAGVEHYSWRFG